MGPKADAQAVFNNWENANRWPETSTAVLIGTTQKSAQSIYELC